MAVLQDSFQSEVGVGVGSEISLFANLYSRARHVST